MLCTAIFTENGGQNLRTNWHWWILIKKNSAGDQLPIREVFFFHWVFFFSWKLTLPEEPLFPPQPPPQPPVHLIHWSRGCALWHRSIASRPSECDVTLTVTVYKDFVDFNSLPSMRKRKRIPGRRSTGLEVAGPRLWSVKNTDENTRKEAKIY